MSCKQCSKYRPKHHASLFSIYTEQAFVAGISSPVKCPWNQVFYISIKVLSLCSLAPSTAIITMAPNSLIMPTPHATTSPSKPNTAPTLLYLGPRQAHLSLLAANQRAVCGIIRVRDRLWLWVSPWEALMKYPRGDLAQQGCC